MADNRQRQADMHSRYQGLMGLVRNLMDQLYGENQNIVTPAGTNVFPAGPNGDGAPGSFSQGNPTAPTYDNENRRAVGAEIDPSVTAAARRARQSNAY